MVRIKLDYDRTITAANSLARCAENCHGEAKSIKNGLCDSVDSLWKGEAASCAKQKLTDISSDIEAISAEIEAAAKAIRTAADHLKAADEFAAQGNSR